MNANSGPYILCALLSTGVVSCPWVTRFDLSSSSLWSWDWAAFWTQFAATILGIVGSLLVLYVGYRLELSRRRDDNDRRFEGFARQVLADIDNCVADVDSWLGLVESQHHVQPFDPVFDLTWNVAGHEIVQSFVERGLWQNVNLAFGWYRSAVSQVTAWNAIPPASLATAPTFADTSVRLRAASSRLKDARTHIARALRT